jgi:hypothetical protein
VSDSQDGYASVGPLAPPGDGRLFRVRLTKVSSFIIMTQQRHATYTGTVEQLEAAARSVQIWTPMALARNAKGMRQVHELASRPPGT